MRPTSDSDGLLFTIPGTTNPQFSANTAFYQFNNSDEKECPVISLTIMNDDLTDLSTKMKKYIKIGIDNRKDEDPPKLGNYIEIDDRILSEFPDNEL